MAKRGGGSGRKYVRDNRGRFATTGATARGGRLKTASGKKRAVQTVKAKTGGKPAGALKAKPRSEGQKYAKRVQAGKDLKRSQSTAREKKFFAETQKRLDAAPLAQSRAARSKPTARTSKAPTNKAKVAYKRASGDARMRNADLRGADAKERRMANSASAKVKNMQRRRSASTPKAGADAPRSKQKARELARVKRASSNERKAYAARGDGAGTAKQSRSASVAKRAQDIYSGKISASKKTTSRLTRTQNPDVLRARIKKGEKLTAARAKKKSVTANSARAAAKRRGAVGKISEAKAGRIVARMDAQRGRKALPGRRNANFVRTAERRSQFILKPAATARNKGKAISVNESVQKAVANAAKRRKAKPAAAKPAVSSARDAATARLKIKTATRRKLKADRSSVIPANPKARRVQGARIGSTVAKKSRAKGNAPATIANRVKRKSAVNKANLKENTRYGNATDGKRYVRQIKTSMTLDRAQNFLKTGKLPGKDNSIKAQRSFKAANARINANRAARQMSQKEKWAARAEKRRTQATKAEANAKRLRDANRKVGDNAFWTQPGLGKQRDKARAGLDKSFKELERAKKLRSRADNLERMSKRNKGDAASRQQSRRDKFDSRKISKGQTVNSTLYGPVKVLRVNKKTVTISLNGGKPFTEDKSRFKEAL